MRAIETPGGDDDRQWLTFWIIMMTFFLAERFTDVLLSRLPRYYEAKFLAIVWLMFFQGADKLYRLVRVSLKRLTYALPYLFPRKRQMSEEEYIQTLPSKAMRQAAVADGLEALLSSFRCDHDITVRFGSTTLMRLWRMWNKVDPRYLVLELHSASNLPSITLRIPLLKLFCANKELVA